MTAGQILLYQSADGRTKLDVRLENEIVWLSQRQLTELFGKAKGMISEHIKHIFEDGELVEESVVRSFRTTALDGKLYEVAHYNLDMVIALGFRVRSPAAVRFRCRHRQTCAAFPPRPEGRWRTTRTPRGLSTTSRTASPPCGSRSLGPSHGGSLAVRHATRRAAPAPTRIRETRRSSVRPPLKER